MEFVARRELKSLAKQTNPENALRVGIVGCGRVARRHLWGYLKTGRVAISAASDPSPKQRQALQSLFQTARVYADFAEMFQREQLDMVSICAPPRFHAPAVLAAVASGVRVILCEKPIGLDLAEADEMIRQCEAKGVILAVGHQRRYGPQHILAKRLLAEDTIGTLRHVFADCPRDILRAGIHGADMLLDYVGSVTAVTASLTDGKGGPAKSPQDACRSAEAGDKQSVIFVEFQNGVSATMRVENRSGLDAKLTFLGEEGQMEVWWDGGMRYRRNADLAWTTPPLQYNPYWDEFHWEIRALIDALEQKTKAPISGHDGRHSLELVLAILTSNHESRRVALPLTPSHATVLAKVSGER